MLNAAVRMSSPVLRKDRVYRLYLQAYAIEMMRAEGAADMQHIMDNLATEYGGDDAQVQLRPCVDPAHPHREQCFNLKAAL